MGLIRPKSAGINAANYNELVGGRVNYPASPLLWWIVRFDITNAGVALEGDTSQDFDLNALNPNKTFPTDVIVAPGSHLNLIELFSGGTVAACTAILGHGAEAPHSADDNGLVTEQDIFTGADTGVKQAATQASAGLRFPALSPILQIDTTTGDVDELTAGLMEILIPYYLAPPLATS